MFFTFRNRLARLLIRLALALAALLILPAAIDAVGGCGGGSMGPACSRLPDVFGDIAFGLHVMWLVSGFYLLAPLTMALLLLGGIVFEVDTRRQGKG